MSITNHIKGMESSKKPAICLIDGLNLYHSINDAHPELGYPYRKYKWLDLWKLASQFILPDDELKEVHYFTCVGNWDREKAVRHERYIYALKNSGVRVKRGKFKEVTRTCRGNCKMNYMTNEEKRTDVAIAATLISFAHLNIYNSAYIITADTDQIPAIEEVKRCFREKNLYLLLPINSKAEELSSICTNAFKIKEQHLKTSLFEWEMKSILTGKPIKCPEQWKNAFEEEVNL